MGVMHEGKSKGTAVCSVVTTEDGRTFVGAVLNSKYDNAITMYRGIQVKLYDLQTFIC